MGQIVRGCSQLTQLWKSELMEMMYYSWWTKTISVEVDWTSFYSDLISAFWATTKSTVSCSHETGGSEQEEHATDKNVARARETDIDANSDMRTVQPSQAQLEVTANWQSYQR